MLVLQLLIFCIQTKLITQAAEMKITSLSQLGKFGTEERKVSRMYNDRDFDNIYNELILKPVVKRDCKKTKSFHLDDCNCKHPVVELSNHIATSDFNKDLHTADKKIHFNKKILGKRDTYEVKTVNRNDTNILSNEEAEVHETPNNVLNIIHRDLDNFYDHELINKLSDSNGKLPTSLKVIIPADKEPIVVVNESNDSVGGKKIEKRNADSTKTNVYYDYNYYDEQPLDGNRLNSGEYEIRKKFSTLGNLVNNPVYKLNMSTIDNTEGVNNSASLGTFTDYKVHESTAAYVENTSLETSSKKEEEDGSLRIKNHFFKTQGTFNDKIKAVVKRKGTCPPSQSGAGQQGCHPSGGLPKSPELPPLIKKGRDPEYSKLLKGETSENVVKGILEKLHSSPQIASELGICDFDVGEQRNLFKQMRNKERKECCYKLKGEFKCFMHWLLTIEPSRKKRSENSQDHVNSCNQFPKFNIMGAGDCCPQPSPQYEKLEQKVEEYKDENNNF